MGRRNYKINSKMRRRKSAPSARVVSIQGKVIRQARNLSILAVCFVIPAAIYVCSLPEDRKLEALQGRLLSSQKSEQVSIQANDRIKREINAYKTNPDYLEIIARDHLNLAKEGETIIRIIR